MDENTDIMALVKRLAKDVYQVRLYLKTSKWSPHDGPRSTSIKADADVALAACAEIIEYQDWRIQKLEEALESHCMYKMSKEDS